MIVNLLRALVTNAHETLEGTMEGVTQSHMDWQPPGRANSIGATYAHLVLFEDLMVNGVLTSGEPLFKTKFAGKAGVNKYMPVPGTNYEMAYRAWTQTVMTDLPQLKAYAQAVYDRTDEVFLSMTEDELLEKVNLTSMGMDSQTKEHVITEYIAGHANNIAGEISALKGIQGLKGYPF